MKITNNKLYELSENKVLREFAKRLNVTPMQIIGKGKCSYITDIRHLYCKLRYEMHGVTYLIISYEISKNLTTVRYGVMRINRLLLLNDKKTTAMWNKVKDIGGYYI